MSDRELLESLGYRAKEMLGPRYDITSPDGRSCLISTPTEERAWATVIESMRNYPELWLELDDALAKRGWKTSLNNFISSEGERYFQYEAWRNRGDRHPAIQAATRNLAVRRAYEQVITAQNQSESRS